MASIAERIPEQMIEQAKQVDVRVLAERYTTLRKAAGEKELEGPCPKCGGSNRFHCQAEWFFCRGGGADCHPKRGDAIEFVRWMNPGLSFADAVQQLTGGYLPAVATQRRPVQKQAPAQSPEWRKNAATIAAEAHARLWTPEGERAQQYLLGRCIEPHAWQVYGLGFRPDAPLPGTKREQRAPAIVLPWRAGSGIYALRYRFLEVQKYTDLEGAARSEKLVAEYKSDFTGKLFGGQALPDFVRLPVEDGRDPAERRRWLLIVEGEINAISAWQVAAETNLDVVSLGSESARLSDAAIEFAKRYGRVLVWADRAEIAQHLMQALPGAYGVRSPGGQDANDMLRAGKLGGFLALARADGAQNHNELERLLWALWDAAGSIQGIDTGSAQVCKHLAAKLGKGAEIVEIEPGRWVQASKVDFPEPSMIIT